jgi:hypothetical protein
MSLILAIEPDPRQSARLADLVRRRLDAELVHAPTTEAALAALVTIGDRVPDLVLVPSLLSPQEDAAIAGALRVIATAANVRMLTIPLLADPKQTKPQTGVFARLRGKKAKTPPAGCDPDVFADQIAAYLEEAAAERLARREDLVEDLTAVAAAGAPRAVRRQAPLAPLLARYRRDPAPPVPSFADIPVAAEEPAPELDELTIVKPASAIDEPEIETPASAIGDQIATEQPPTLIAGPFEIAAADAAAARDDDRRPSDEPVAVTSGVGSVLFASHEPLVNAVAVEARSEEPPISVILPPAEESQQKPSVGDSILALPTSVLLPADQILGAVSHAPEAEPGMAAIEDPEPLTFSEPLSPQIVASATTPDATPGHEPVVQAVSRGVDPDAIAPVTGEPIVDSTAATPIDLTSVLAAITSAVRDSAVDDPEPAAAIEPPPSAQPAGAPVIELAAAPPIAAPDTSNLERDAVATPAPERMEPAVPSDTAIAEAFEAVGPLAAPTATPVVEEPVIAEPSPVIEVSLASAIDADSTTLHESAAAPPPESAVLATLESDPAMVSEAAALESESGVVASESESVSDPVPDHVLESVIAALAASVSDAPAEPAIQVASVAEAEPAPEPLFPAPLDDDAIPPPAAVAAPEPEAEPEPVSVAEVESVYVMDASTALEPILEFIAEAAPIAIEPEPQPAIEAAADIPVLALDAVEDIADVLAAYAPEPAVETPPEPVPEPEPEPAVEAPPARVAAAKRPPLEVQDVDVDALIAPLLSELAAKRSAPVDAREFEPASAFEPPPPAMTREPEVRVRPTYRATTERRSLRPSPTDDERAASPAFATTPSPPPDGEIDPMFFADDALIVPPPTPAQAERSAWIELVESLRQDIERLKTERAAAPEVPPAPEEPSSIIKRTMSSIRRAPASAPPKAPPKPALKPRPKSRRPVEDQWGLFDPEQCGFAALLAKLDEISAREDASA